MISHALRAAASLALLAVMCVGAQKPATAARATKPPVIDGIIGADEWAGATRFEDFVQIEPQRGKPATQKTVGYFLYDDNNVYIAVHAYDDQPERIIARHSQRDGQLRLPQGPRDPVAIPDDTIIVFLDTFHDRHTCYFFATNPLGTQTDGVVQDNGRIFDVTWDAAWEVAARKMDDGWMAEFAIPLRSMLFRTGQGRSWGFNILRARRSTMETSIWNGPVESMFRVSQYGEIQGLDLKRGGARPYTFMPYILGRYEQGRTLRGDIGLDARYVFRPETTLNVTVNPDFATIEGDEEFVNLSRFEARLTEKRPFFLETNQKFQQRIQTFYSRRIENIDVGARLLSKGGGWDSTLLVARSRIPLGLTGPDNRLEGATYAIGRAERQYLKSSVLGVMVANRSFNGENRGSVGLDTTATFTRTFGLTGQVVRSYGPYKNGVWAWFARPSYDSSTAHAHFRYLHLGDRFGENVNAIGYVRDDDRREMDSDLSKTLWFQTGPLQRVIFESKNNIYWSQRNVLRGYHILPSAKVDFRNRWSISTLYRNEFRLFEKGFHNRLTEVLVGHNTREYQSWALGYQTGKSFDSDMKAINGYLRRKLRPETAFEYQLSRVWLKPDPTLQATFINIFRVRHNFTRDLFLRLFFQTNSVIDRKNTEAVFVWRYRPPFGSIQFAYQRGRAAFGERSQQGNTYFVKLVHVY